MTDTRRHHLLAVLPYLCVALLWFGGSVRPAAGQAVNRDDILYIMPYWFPFAGASTQAAATEIADMRRRLGPEGPYVKFGMSVYVFVSMDDWAVDINNPAALKTALAPTIAQIDRYIAKARAADVPLSFSVLTAIRDRYDPVQTASEAEDVRSMMWYADNVVARGWWTHSRYARRAKAVQEAYVRELGKVIANRMHQYPDIVVAACGDGEVELAYAREGTIYADYSPFTVAEFRDWLRHGGSYAPGHVYAGQGYEQGARYAGDAAPGVDTNGDGHTLNGDFGTQFQTWDLLHFNWSLADGVGGSDPRAIPLATYSDAGFDRMPGQAPGGFDAPRQEVVDYSNPWWNVWVLFKQTLLQHHNTDFAKWMTTSVDPETGATIPATRWYSYQIPSDYAFNGTPQYPTPRFRSSMSAWWTGDIHPYGGAGITAFNLDWAGYPNLPENYVAYTLKWVAPRIAAADRRWGIIEWNPGLLPFEAGVTQRMDIYRDEMAVVEQYRPSLLQPFAWGDATNRVQDTGFETTLRDLVARLRDGDPPDPHMAIEAPSAASRLSQPFSVTGWAIDLGKIRGPGRGPGVDQVLVYAHPNPGSGTPRVLLGAANYGAARGNIAAQHGAQFRPSGFSFLVQGLVGGVYDLEVVARSSVSPDVTISRTVRVDIVVPLVAAPTALQFTATKGGASGALLSTSGPQQVTVQLAGLGVPEWTATANQPWMQIENGSGIGPGAFTVSIVNPSNVIGGATSLNGSITLSAPNVGGAGSVPVTLRVTQPTLSVSPSTLAFAGTNNAGTLDPITGPQDVTVSFGAVAAAWTAVADQPWVQITNGGGSRAGTFTVQVVNPGNVLAGVTRATATVTVTAPGAAGSPRTVAVDLALREIAATTPPVGLVDTPLPNATGLAGTIGVTGWVVDDVGVTTVQVYRNCLDFEPGINCSSVNGRTVVFIGDATMVAGARPDVEQLYPNLPQAGRAAWGYLLLTNMLPHVPRQEMFGGQGTLTLHVLATDVEGKQVWLGRSITDTTPTTITLANDTDTRPFGAIDTPAQGETVSGVIANFGWALTPDTNTVGGEPGDILVPPNGSTLRVYIDGVPGATIAYNQCRGTTALGPVPAGVYCDDDVASIFGHPSPQATNAPRAGNPTVHRNLDAGRGAIGALLIDTTTLTNGVHTIMWGVTDSAGRGEGLGSRYFTVLNAGADGQVTDGSRVQGARPKTDALTARGSRPSVEPGTTAAPGRPAAVPDTTATDPGVVRARMGLDAAPPWVTLEPDESGVRHVTIPVMGRLELRVPGSPADAAGAGVTGAYWLANGEHRAIPPGSHFDPRTGTFTWAPGVGYLGTYRLEFLRGGETLRIDVTIVP